ncbi:ABC transporter permease [Leptobacterium flavescens]|uniref:ABC transporter permease n=1 Tax=Leptobacterium flavescens TaxID=472055 RepID=A0A6P0UYC3_9FLAO|nr:ABC transporter permease [Leptobacterium flavescens]NER15456.1 ABC transporter permease [Leptobacterium flavescens]
MDKLKLIIKREYLAKVRNRSFIVMTILSPILIVGMIALIVFLTKVNADEKKIIAVLDDSEHFHNVFKTTDAQSYVVFKDLGLQEAKDSVVSIGYYGLLHFPSGDDLNSIAANSAFYSNKAPGIGILSDMESTIENRLREEKLKGYGLNSRDLEDIGRNFEIRTESFTGERNLKGVNEIKAIIGGSFGYLIMMFIIIYGAFVMRSVIEEKTSRIIEVIISSVKPFQLMLGKILGTAMAGVTQFVIWIISAGVLSLILFSVMGIDMDAFNSTANLPPETMDAMAEITDSQDKLQPYIQELGKLPIITLLVSFVIYFILGYLIYSSIYAAIGAAVDNETDTQQFMLPVIMPLVLAIYVGFFSVFENPHGPIAVGFSLFPLTSPIVMLMRLPSGIGADGVPLWQFITSILLLIGTFICIVWLASKIYRVGILMYGKKPSYKELYKWLKY